VVNVAAGTYAEGVDASGLIGDGGKTLTILGDEGNPGGASFTGSVACNPDSSVLPSINTPSAVCAAGPVALVLKGITINATARNGIGCTECVVVLDDVVISGSTTAGVNVSHGRVTIRDNVTISGFSSSGGFGLYLAHGAVAIQDKAGTLTITGPGGGSTTALGIVEEFSATYTILSSGSTNISITGVQIGFLLSSTSSFNSFVSTGTISATNSTTPTSSQGVYTTAASSFNIAGAGLTVDHFTTCLWAYTLSVIDQGPGNRTLSNCTQTASAQGSQIVIY